MTPKYRLKFLFFIVPEVITQDDFDHYIDAVHNIRWVIHSQFRSYNEQAIDWILKARPDLTKKPEKKKEKLELPFPLRSQA